jgi:hypothetical protein
VVAPTPPLGAVLPGTPWRELDLDRIQALVMKVSIGLAGRISRVAWSSKSRTFCSLANKGLGVTIAVREEGEQGPEDGQ